MPPIMVAIVGPTATGKSALSLEIAARLGGEVINADSMQLYRGMDIGTAKLTLAQRRGVPHHLLDIWDITTSASVVAYQRLVRTVVDQVLSRGATPILVGGSGLYVRAALDRLEFPGTDPALRAELEAELADVGPGVLHARLAAVNPSAAAAILPSNGRRLVRALEVEMSGTPFVATLGRYEYLRPTVQVGLCLPRPLLRDRVALRVEWMRRAGLVDEVRRLEAAGLRDGRTASRALGYAQVLRFLDGDCTEDQAFADTVGATRRFARRQESWFRRDARVRWLPADAGDLVARAIAAIRGTAGG